MTRIRKSPRKQDLPRTGDLRGTTTTAVPIDPRAFGLVKACAYQKPCPYDFLTESPNVGHDGRTYIAVVEPGCLALQVQEPT